MLGHGSAVVRAGHGDIWAKAEVAVDAIKRHACRSVLAWSKARVKQTPDALSESMDTANFGKSHYNS